jgi:hypothetical protein
MSKIARASVHIMMGHVGTAHTTEMTTSTTPASVNFANVIHGSVQSVEDGEIFK